MIGSCVLVLGGTSSIARALAGELAARGATIHLAGRDLPEVERIAHDLRIRHRAVVTCGHFEAEDYRSHATTLEDAIARMGGVDCVVIGFGALGEQRAAEADFESARRIIDSNYTGAVSILTHVANHLERQARGSIVVITSVAGDRGRAQNYVYGSAKGGLTIYLQGLRARLSRSGVQVLTAKLGSVDTKMTFGRKGGLLVADPSRVAASLATALARKRDVVYIPAYWQAVMLAIQIIPERMYKRMSI